MTDSKTLEFTSHHVDATIQLGKQLGMLLEAGDVICLSGNLGAGKTALTRGIGAGWQAQEPVTSPTFTLIHEHHRAHDAQPLYHVDCYRLSGAEEAWGIGLEDLLHGDGVAVLEWPENIADALPDERLWIDLDIQGDDERRLRLHATGTRYCTLLGTLASRDNLMLTDL